MKALDVIRRPLLTEKSEGQREGLATVTFEVHPKATKIEIADAVERQFKVKVAEVRVARMHGKLRRQGRFAGHRPDWKKAYVRLAPGEKTIDFLEII